MRALRWLLLGLGLLALVFLLAGAMAPQSVLRAWQSVEAWRSGARAHALLVEDHRWHWLEAGEGPPLLLLHGFTGSKENWLPLMRALRRDFRVIAPDLPGWGDSSRIPGADYGFAAQALRVNAFMAALELRDAVLAGHSMGGGIAAVAASQRPPGLRGLVLMDAAGVPFEENDFARAVLDGGHPFAVGGSVALKRYLGLVFKDPPFVPWPLSRALVERRVADRGFEEQVLDAVGRGPAAFLPQRAAAAIRTPTLLLWCAEDRIIDPSAMDQWRRAIGEAVVDRALLGGCNHMPMMERPAETARALRDFVAILP